MTTARIVVTGAGGFIGHHLVKRLKADGHWVRGTDIKLPQYEASDADEFDVLDLRAYENCLLATRGGIDQVYNLAADMGGIGYITSSLASISRNNILINANMLEASRQNSVKRFLFSSSACVYAQSKQLSPSVVPLVEEDAYPAEPEPGRRSSLRKSFANIIATIITCRPIPCASTMCTGRSALTKVARKKAPAAVSRKVALAQDGGEIEIWGDGEQTRSFMYVDDCVEGLVRLMASNHHEALNLGTDRLITINGLADLVSSIANKRLTKRHDLSKPQGVRGRNSDNTRLKQVLGWEPSISLETGLEVTYKWIEGQLKQEGSVTSLMHKAVA